ncbi:RHS repeat-associated core domain containing protein [Nitzschia inconspicua]|uniref:RHS repeat-associated core domain containing protein n=1 Tax=Nitzschia inconspicua TaxID=303405 RepID=A0A9K3KU57_9STRA|nr:RHS repeat-associated core domain containing protein [Nitzschia inconspicua]
MLARARFETETPNVIDAGEDAPSRPKRQVGRKSRNLEQRPLFDENVRVDSTSQASISTSTNDTRQTLYATSNKGHISKGIRIHYSLEADDEPDASPAVEDEYGGEDAISDSNGYSRNNNEGDDSLKLRGKRLASQRPQPKRVSSISPQENERSMREARLFAAAMLNESERRINLHNEKNLSLRQESSSSLRQIMTKAVTGGSSRRFYDEISLVEEPAIRPHDPKRFRRRMMCRLVTITTVVAILVLFCVFALDATRDRNSHGNGKPAKGDPARLEATITFLFEKEISTARALYDESSPQYQAARWLAMEDPEQLAVPFTDNNPEGGLRNTIPFRFIQRYVLAVLYYALQGDDWVQPHKFVSDAHECSWFESIVQGDGVTYAMGVTCDETMHVRNLFLPNNNLVGVLPPEIQHLSKLDFLDLHNNTLTGSIPTELKSLSLLNFLDLNFNQITGTIPHWLGDSLRRLHALGLSDNLLHGSIPESLASGLEQNLKTLSLDGNMLTGDIVPIQRLRYLQYLYLNDNDFEGGIDRDLLADMRFLEQVDLSGNRISRTIPSYIFSMESLKVLDLSNNRLTGVIPDDIVVSNGGLSLEYLSFRNNSLSGNIPDDIIPYLSGLYHLDLSFNQLTGDCPELIGNVLTNLSHLFLGGNSLSLAGGTIPEQLQELSNLHELSLGNLSLQGTIPTWIENFEHLRLLDLSENQLTGSIDLNFTKMKHLRYLLLHDNSLTGSLPQSMRTLQNLMVMSLHLNDITDDTIAPSICADLPQFEFMTVDCNEIDCPCCDECCDSETCFERITWEKLEHDDGNWEDHFERSDSSFNPHITLTGATFKGEACGDKCV